MDCHFWFHGAASPLLVGWVAVWGGVLLPSQRFLCHCPAHMGLHTVTAAILPQWWHSGDCQVNSSWSCTRLRDKLLTGCQPQRGVCVGIAMRLTLYAGYAKFVVWTGVLPVMEGLPPQLAQQPLYLIQHFFSECCQHTWLCIQLSGHDILILCCDNFPAKISHTILEERFNSVGVQAPGEMSEMA